MLKIMKNVENVEMLSKFQVWMLISRFSAILLLSLIFDDSQGVPLAPSNNPFEQPSNNLRTTRLGCGFACFY